MAVLDRTLVQIRERSFAELLDLAVVVVRSRPLAVLGSAAAGILPFAALNALLTSGTPEPGSVLMLMALEAPLATAPLTVALGMLMFGDRPGPGKVARAILRAFPAILVYLIAIRGFLLLTFVFALVIPARLAFLEEVILLERGRFWRVIRRSGQLCAGRGGDLVGFAMVSIGLAGLFVASVWVGTGSILGAIVESDPTWDRPAWSDLLSWRFQVPAWGAIAFLAVARFLTYIDTRIRLEGWEVEQQLRAVAAAMEDGRTW